MEKLVVVSHNPRRRLQLVAGIAALCALLAGIGFFLGLNMGQAWVFDLAEERDELAAELESTRKLNESLQSNLARVEMGAKIDRAATEQARLELKAQQDESVVLKEEISLYQGLMNPGGLRGLTTEE